MRICSDLKCAKGRTAVVKVEGDFYSVYENGELVLKVRRDFDVLEILADLGYECAVMEGMEGEVETVKSIVKSLKDMEDSKLCGAIAVFIGFVREFSRGKRVVRLEYERYDEMYGEKVRELEERLKGDGVYGVKIYHKVGSLAPGEDIVYVAVMGRDRRSVFKALMECVEAVKRELPIWKKEVYEDGEVWVHDLQLS